VEIVATFQTDYFISGIAPFGDALVILAFMPDADVASSEAAGVNGSGGDGGEATDGSRTGAAIDDTVAEGGSRDAASDGRRPPSQRPEVRIVSWTNEDLTCDALGIKGFEAYQANDYRLAALLPVATGKDGGVGAGGVSGADWGSSAMTGDKASAARRRHWWRAGDEPLYYLVSPQDVVLGRPRTVDDHLQWLVQRGDFEEALEACEAAESAGTLNLGGGGGGGSGGGMGLVGEDSSTELEVSGGGGGKDGAGVHCGQTDRGGGGGGVGGGTSPVLDQIAAKYLDRLLSDGQASKAAALCPRLLRGSAAAWERWVFHFAHLRQLPCLAPYIPTQAPQLKDTVYEVVLNAFLANAGDHARFLATVKAWPARLYSVPGLISAVRQRIATSSGGGDGGLSLVHGRQRSDLQPIRSSGGIGGGDSPVLKEALAELYLADGQRERALAKPKP